MNIIRVWHRALIFTGSLLMAGQIFAAPVDPTPVASATSTGFLVFENCRLLIQETIYSIGRGDASGCRGVTIDDTFSLEGVRSAVSIRITTEVDSQKYGAINLRTIKDNVNTPSMTFRYLMNAPAGKVYVPGLIFQGVENPLFVSRRLSQIGLQLNK